MSAIMDMYFNTTDSLSLQEMLDIDIKAEVDTLIGGHTDFSGFNFADLPPLELDDGIRWFSSNSHHHHHTLSNSSFNLDFSTCGGDDDDEENATTAATMMVNPHVVMPVLSFSSDSFRSPSPSLKESHLAFSPSHMKLVAAATTTTETAAGGGGSSKIMFDGGNNKLMIDGNKMIIDGGGVGKKVKVVPPVVTAVKKDLMSTLNGVRVTERKSVMAAATVAPPPVTKYTKVTPILTKSIVKAVTKQQQQQQQQPTLLSFRNTVQRHQLNSPITVSQVSNITSIRNLSTLNSNPRKHFSTASSTHPSLNSTTTTAASNNTTTDHRIFPKPAYSYSCLIAMALKNSRSGSLPVSEIYSFMCAHFPYFKTAPNGWKNSVRHNLSLNKCFEKIEKPALNGAQRKGCLWAMNPDKVVKMDEEVQKWSRKDPLAIRKAMVFPENLEALERGELKFSCSYDETEPFGDSCGSAESEEGSDSEPEQEVDHQYSTTPQFINITSVKVEDPDYDHEVASMYDDEQEIEDDEDILRMEMALAEKELLQYEQRVTTSNAKRRKTTYYIQQ